MFKSIKKLFSNPEKENIELIRNSKYFDKQYYQKENPKIKGDPCRHYYYYGWKEGKSPSFDFSNNFYLKNYKDVEDAGINPLLHYLKFGKSENRIIEKDNGLTIKKIYEKIYGCTYFYKTYIYDTNIKRLNLFFDSIDKNVEKLNSLIKYIVEFCETQNYNLRIIYSKADFEILKKVLNDNKINLPKQTIFLNLKSSNYLEVGLNEKYVCTSWKTARALLNTASLNNNIYYYLLENIQELPKEEYYQISNICMNTHVIPIVKNKKIIDSIKKCQLKFEISNQKLNLNNANYMYCDFDKMFIVGIELLNESFLEGILDSKKWKVNILENEKDFKFHFDTKVNIKKTTSINEDANLIFKMSYIKQNVLYDKPFINAWVEEEHAQITNYILIDDKNSYQKLLDSEKKTISNIDNFYNKFKKYIYKLKQEDEQ